MALGALAVVVFLVVRLLITSDRTLGASMTVRVLTPTLEVAHPSAAFAPAEDGQVLAEGDRARTGDAGHAVINFFDGSSLQLDPSTEIAVTGVDSRDGGLVASFTQAIGRTWSSVRNGTNARYEIKTPATTAVVRGTGFEVIVLPDGATTVRVVEGLIAVSAQGVTVAVQPGLQTTVTPGQPPPPPVPLTAGRLRVALRSPAATPTYLGVIDPLNRICGFIDPVALTIPIPGPIGVNHIPLCSASPPSAGIATAEIVAPVAGAYTVFITPSGRGAMYGVETSGVLGAALNFALVAGGDIIAGELLAARFTLAVAPDGTLSSTGLTLLKVDAVTIAAGAPSPAEAIGVITLASSAPVALVPVKGGTPLATRPVLAVPPGTGVSLAAILGSGGLLLAGLFMFKDFMKPVYLAASVTAVVAFITAGLSVLFFYRDFVISTFYRIGRLLQ